MHTVRLAQQKVHAAQEKVEPAVYQEDLVGYVFMLVLVGSLITAYLFWYFVARDMYPGASAPASKTKAEPHAPGAGESADGSGRND